MYSGVRKFPTRHIFDKHIGTYKFRNFINKCIANEKQLVRIILFSLFFIFYMLLIRITSISFKFLFSKDITKDLSRRKLLYTTVDTVSVQFNLVKE